MSLAHKKSEWEIAVLRYKCTGEKLALLGKDAMVQTVARI